MVEKSLTFEAGIAAVPRTIEWSMLCRPWRIIDILCRCWLVGWPGERIEALLRLLPPVSSASVLLPFRRSTLASVSLR